MTTRNTVAVYDMARKPFLDMHDIGIAADHYPAGRWIRAAAAEHPACMFAFDLLWRDGKGYRACTLLERKWALYETLGQRGRVRHAGHFADSSEALWQMAVELELEGIVAKDAQSVYVAGRSTRWQKIKTAVGADRERSRRPK